MRRMHACKKRPVTRVRQMISENHATATQVKMDNEGQGVCVSTCCSCTARLPTFVGASLENWEAEIALEQLGQESTTVTVTGGAFELQTPCQQREHAHHLPAAKCTRRLDRKKACRRTADHALTVKAYTHDRAGITQQPKLSQMSDQIVP